MTRGANSGPAVMLMPPHVRATFMPNPPLQHMPVIQHHRKHEWTGVSAFMSKLETTPAPERTMQLTPAALKEKRRQLKRETMQKEQLEPAIETYRQAQRECGGEFSGMNCYNTLFIGRLAYEVTERKLLREMEAFGPIKDIQIVKDKAGKSRGYAFCEYEHEDDMKRAYRAADSMKIEGRFVVVDVERGHTVPTWLPRRLGGGLGGTRLGSRHENFTRPGRFDPARPEMAMGGPGPGKMGMGRGGGGGGPPPPGQYGGGYGGGGRGGGGGYRGGPPPPGPGHNMGRGGGDHYGGGGGHYGGGGGGHYGGGGGGAGPGSDRKRHRSPSPDRRYGGGGGGGRRRY